MRCVLAFLIMSVGAAAHAIDADGRYAVKGAGAAKCSQFLEARAARNGDYFKFGGWLEGFVTAANLYEEQTFDVVPWQNTDTLAALMANHCAANPDLQFQDAARAMVGAFFPSRLEQRQPLVPIEHEGGAVALYRGVVERIQARLAELDLLDASPSGRFTAATRTALEAYQARNGLAVTGMPDQATLVYLLTAEGEMHGRDREK